MDAKVINKWRQANKRLFYQFPSEWVAFSPEKGILAHHQSRKTVAEMLLEAGYSRLDFIMEYYIRMKLCVLKEYYPLDDVEEMIIGREIVFDMFDVEFKQRDEEIIFRRREDDNIL